MEISTNATISHYRIVSKIGAGGMGEVYLAEDTKLARKVALKVLASEFADDKDRMDRFVREAKSASALNHPNIITIYEIGESDGVHYIATEFIDGKTLNEYAKSKSFSLKAAIEIAVQVGSALDEAHSAGIVHRDIKPDNVMIRSNGLAKILDFGIAKATGSTNELISGEEAATAIQNGTRPGMIIGTPHYMSPEQAKGIGVDARSDIFSFGVVLYEMIAGHLPFQAKDVHRKIIAIQEVVPAPLSQEVEGVPVRLEEIVEKCLAKDKNERYQTAKDLLIDLRNLRRKIDVDAEIDRTVAPSLRGTSAAAAPSTQSASAVPPPTASSAPTAACPARRRPRSSIRSTPPASPGARSRTAIPSTEHWAGRRLTAASTR